MDEMMAALRTQLEYMVDAEENDVVSFGPIDGENAFGIEFEDGRQFFVSVEQA